MAGFKLTRENYDQVCELAGVLLALGFDVNLKGNSIQAFGEPEQFRGRTDVPEIEYQLFEESMHSMGFEYGNKLGAWWKRLTVEPDLGEVFGSSPETPAA